MLTMNVIKFESFAYTCISQKLQTIEAFILQKQMKMFIPSLIFLQRVMYLMAYSD